MRSVVAVLFAMLTCLGCDPFNEIHVEPGSSAHLLTLHAFLMPDSVDGIGAITGITVGRCATATAGPIVWSIERRRPRFSLFGGRGTTRESTRLEYGNLPSGRWTTTHPPEPL